MKAKILHQFTRQLPLKEYSYSYTPAHERIVTWLKTPAGTIVRQAEYRTPEQWRVVWPFKRKISSEYECETRPFDSAMDAIRVFMEDIGVSLDEAAEKLELGDSW